MKLLLNILILVLGLFYKAYCNDQYEGCSGKINESPVYHLKPRIVSKTKGGKRYIMEKNDTYVHIMNVTGTPYEMGYAQGRLMKEEIKYNMDHMFAYIENDFYKDLRKNGYPRFVAKALVKAKMGLFEGALELDYKTAKPYIPQRYIDEMQGMADGSDGLFTFQYVMNYNMIPELTKASCSIVGTWDQATVNGDQYNLRALDWNDDAPISKNPQITIYHSTEKTEQTSYAFANIGYSGMIGSITAVGSQGVSIQEKHWIPRDRNIPDTYKGKPWPFVIRDLSQFGTTVENMADTLYNTHRTVKIHIGMGSKMSRSFEIANYGWQELETFNDKNYTYYGPDHPQMNGVAYVDRHPQPSNDPCLGNILEQNYGNITAETLYRKVTGLHKTGDTQICVTDVYHNHIYLSYSSFKDNIKAFERPLMFIDLNKFFGTQSQQNLEEQEL